MKEIDLSTVDNSQSIEFEYTDTLTLPINISDFNLLKAKLEDLFERKLTKDQCFNILACN